MSLKDKIVVVTGGSRGLGLGLVEALVDQEAKVTVVARSAVDLEAVRARLGVETIAADITDEAAAKRILANTRPEILVLNAGATPRMGPIDELSWEDFTIAWDTDVKGGLYWLQAALNLPLATGAPGLDELERRRAAGLASVGRLRRSQADALVDGQIRQRNLRAEGSRHQVSGDCSDADDRRDRGRRRRRQSLCSSRRGRT